MPNSVTVEAKVVGRRRPVIPDWSVPLPPGTSGAPLTLRDLITCVVRAEVKAFQARQGEQHLQQVLSKAAISTGLAQGKVTLGDRDFEQTVNPETAVDNAIMGFIDGLYYVFLDDIQQEDLDATVHLTSESRLTFVRLVALVGG